MAIQRGADVSFHPTHKPSREARDLLRLWIERRRRGGLPRLSEFHIVELQPWLASMTMTTHLDVRPQVDFYGGSLAAAVGRFYSGVWGDDWPGWFEVIGMRTFARLRGNPEPFTEQAWIKDGEFLRVYDRLVLPLGGEKTKIDGWISFIDNRRLLRPSARAGLIVDR